MNPRDLHSNKLTLDNSFFFYVPFINELLLPKGPQSLRGAKWLTYETQKTLVFFFRFFFFFFSRTLGVNYEPSEEIQLWPMQINFTTIYKYFG